jgi:hypothetical protein
VAFSDLLGFWLPARVATSTASTTAAATETTAAAPVAASSGTAAETAGALFPWTRFIDI